MIVWRQLSDVSVRQSNAEVLACYLLAARRRVADRRVTLPLPIFLFIGKVGALINARALKIAMTCVDERATLIIAD